MGGLEWNEKYANHPLSYKRVCVTCGKEFETYNKGTKYCSVGCCARKRYIELNMTHREWKSLREFILERDNYECQRCGKFAMDLGLAVHHIKPLVHRGTSKETNLITLCHMCHRASHKGLKG